MFQVIDPLISDDAIDLEADVMDLGQVEVKSPL
jgi:hypothetical protein